MEPEKEQETEATEPVAQEPSEAKEEVQAVEATEGEPTEQKAPEESKESDEERNWKAFREKRKQDRLAREQAEKKAKEEEEARHLLQQYLAQSLQDQGLQGQMTPAQQEQAIVDLAADEIPTGGEIKQWFDSQVKKAIQETVTSEIERTKAQSQRERVAQDLKSNMPDWFDVVTEENFDYIAYKAPHLAGVVQRALKDPKNVSYADMAAAYETVKLVVPNTQAREDRQAREDDQRPRSLSQVPASGSRDQAPSRLTEAMRKQHLEEMRYYASQR